MTEDVTQKADGNPKQGTYPREAVPGYRRGISGRIRWHEACKKKGRVEETPTGSVATPKPNQKERRYDMSKKTKRESKESAEMRERAEEANKRAQETKKVVEQDKKQAGEETIVRVCPCGCKAILGKKRVFEQGHDARIRGWFVLVNREKKEASSLPPILQKAFPIWKSKGSGAYVKVAVMEATA